MQELNLEQIRKLQLDILDFVVSFCDDNNISYWLDSGTLIGAVRHGGYIPWDDDIDIGMLRKDYEIFIEKFYDPQKRYTVHHLKNDDSYPFAFAKVYDGETVLYEPDEDGWHLQVNIDIFPYDYIPSNPWKIKTGYFWRSVWRRCNYAYLKPVFPHGSIVRRLSVFILGTAARILPRSFYVNKLLELQTRYDGTEYIGNMAAYAK